MARQIQVSQSNSVSTQCQLFFATHENSIELSCVTFSDTLETQLLLASALLAGDGDTSLPCDHVRLFYWLGNI